MNSIYKYDIICLYFFYQVDEEELNFDKENSQKFRKLCDDLVKRFPLEKLEQLKDILLGNNNYSPCLFSNKRVYGKPL